MKKGIMLILLLLLFASAVWADDGSFVNPVYSPEFIEQQESKLLSIEKLFPRLLFTETFDTATKPQVSKPEDGYYLSERVTRAGKRERIISAYKPHEEGSGWGDAFFNRTGSYADFYMSIEGRIVERDDTGKGYLWIQYTDGDIVGKSSRSSVEVDFPVAIRKYVTRSGVREYTTIYDLSDFRNDHEFHRLEVIRLDGYTSVFIDRRFAAGFEDGFSGRFYHVFGTGLEAGGHYVTGEFDNIMLRVK